VLEAPETATVVLVNATERSFRPPALALSEPQLILSETPETPAARPSTSLLPPLTASSSTVDAVPTLATGASSTTLTEKVLLLVSPSLSVAV
jgi:hypothetical protein